VVKEKYLTITVYVEEWFHSNWFDVDHIINTYYHGVYPESDVVESIDRIITMFDALQIRATFFVLGGTAERYPSIIDSIKDAGHEIASHGYYHNWNGRDVDIFKDHMQKFKKNVFSHPKGFRFPNYIFVPEILETLSDEGFLYDSSIVPSFNIPGWYGDPHAPVQPHVYALHDDRGILEFPISVSPFLRLPGAGGWFLRNVNHPWTYSLIMSQLLKNGYANIYFHNWEVSENNPKLDGIPFHVFRNTGTHMMKKVNMLIELWKKTDSLHIEPFEELLNHEINTPR
jgi:hypothetical protein